MAGTPPIVQVEQLAGNSTRLHIFFSVPTRSVDYWTSLIGGPHPMVPIAVAGDASFYIGLSERGLLWRDVRGA
jgi:hypothetical protein